MVFQHGSDRTIFRLAASKFPSGWTTFFLRIRI
jgi:hypothetical protein